MRMDLSIIILNYDTRSLLVPCLESIPASSADLRLEILIVNNGSPTDTAASLEGLHPDATVLDLPVNIGFGQANNLAASRARGRYLLLLNSDTYIVDGSLAGLGGFLRDEPPDFFGCQVFFPDGSPQACHHPCHADAGARKRALMREVVELNPLVEKVRTRLPRRKTVFEETDPLWLTACCVFVRREAFERTGGFDPDFFLYWEEVEWFYNRVFDQGYSVGVCPEVRIVHLEGASQPESAMRQQHALSEYLFYYKLDAKLFWIAVLLRLVNLVCLGVCLPFIPWYFGPNVRRLRTGLKLLWLALREIPWSPRKFGGRLAPLILDSYRGNYSWSRLSESMLPSAFAVDGD